VPSFTIVRQDLETAGPIVDMAIGVSTILENQLRAANETVAPPVPVHAMIDTGASSTVIQKGLAAKLGLQPVGVTQIATPSSTGVECFEYAVRYILPNNVVADGTVIEAPLEGQQIQALIGRDLLAHAVLVYIGYTGSVTLSF
jgi:predicted aspartyl protease